MVGQSKTTFQKHIALRCATVNNKIKSHEKLYLACRLVKLQEWSNSGLAKDIENYLSAKENLKWFDLKELESTQLRSKPHLLEEGECSIRYF